MTLNYLLQQLFNGEFCLKAPSVTSEKASSIGEGHWSKLDELLKEPTTSGEELVITDPVSPDTS